MMLLSVACREPAASTTSPAASTGPAASAPADVETSVVLYSSVDQPFAREVAAVFQEQTGIEVRFLLDSEASKTAGLVRRLRAEKDRPRADVFWSSELFHTILLAEDGLLAEYVPEAEGIPAEYRDPAGRWTGFGLRARVLAYNTQKIQKGDLPTTWADLADPRWAGTLGFANPQFGTTGGHVAAQYLLWGPEVYRAWLERLKAATAGRLLDGNATAARLVGQGELVLCATDTDDVYVRQAQGEPIDMIYPDLGGGGTLWIPNSVGLVAGGPNPGAGKVLVDFLASAEAERLLARSDSRNVPVRADLRAELGMELPAAMVVDFQAVARAMADAVRLTQEVFAEP